MKNKKTLILSIVAIAVLVCITVGISLAFFNYAQAGTTDNTIETGNITFLYTETSSVGRGIAIEDAFPISNEEGKTLTGEGNVFDFNISATKSGNNKKIDYEITARKSNDSTLDEDVVVIYLTKVNGVNESEILLDKYSELDQTTKTNAYIEKTLYQTKLFASDDTANQDYRLRMWITNDGTFEQEDMGKTFTITVNVYANVAVVTDSQIAFESNTNINTLAVNNSNLEKVENENYDYETALDEGTTSTLIEINTENPNAKVVVTNVTSNFAYIPLTKKLSTQVTLDNLINGDNYFNIKVISENGKVENESILKIYVGKLCAYEPGQTWNFDYTGGIQSWTVPNGCSGIYKLEVWGAEGGASGNVSGEIVGGKGAHVSGEYYGLNDTSLFIVVGGKGGTSYAGWDSAGPAGGSGYNGGGSGANGYSNNYFRSAGGAGGGATHIALASGLISSVEPLIVAGGGGGAWYDAWTSSTTNGSSSSNSNGVRGKGTNAVSTQSASCYSAGGGGYYGGTNGYSGTNFIDNTLINSFSEQGVQSGNGKATITLIELN